MRVYIIQRLFFYHLAHLSVTLWRLTFYLGFQFNAEDRRFHSINWLVAQYCVCLVMPVGLSVELEVPRPAEAIFAGTATLSQSSDLRFPSWSLKVLPLWFVKVFWPDSAILFPDFQIFPNSALQTIITAFSHLRAAPKPDGRRPDIPQHFSMLPVLHFWHRCWSLRCG